MSRKIGREDFGKVKGELFLTFLYFCFYFQVGESEL